MMKRRKVSLSPRNASIVKLNVGGRAFHTTKDTLSLCSYFQPVLDGRLPHGADEHGRLFIDRDPDLFSIILQFVRTCQRSAVVADEQMETIGDCAGSISW